MQFGINAVKGLKYFGHPERTKQQKLGKMSTMSYLNMFVLNVLCKKCLFSTSVLNVCPQCLSVLKVLMFVLNVCPQCLI